MDIVSARLFFIASNCAYHFARRGINPTATNTKPTSPRSSLSKSELCNLNVRRSLPADLGRVPDRAGGAVDIMSRDRFLVVETLNVGAYSNHKFLMEQNKIVAINEVIFPIVRYFACGKRITSNIHPDKFSVL